MNMDPCVRTIDVSFVSSGPVLGSSLYVGLAVLCWVLYAAQSCSAGSGLIKGAGLKAADQTGSYWVQHDKLGSNIMVVF